ncbi:MAG: hypothetical protein GTO45_08760 [Candidatus Aminicenantes bacterium]|nr:hypothetical protein [Candidatus Aminicenantes bacterium]NIM78922.1 hypothetical protein [Candidatus Aminicenantes bacterium]NIN42081.1 hypothetical protein [Candidatus Aminicenantes bacterium]NIN84834.1 hypothetical protein [Candidatus Aminicenantes bacterium]NIO81009.1 hypothetical protein [Candidatus Aminicenantes bacterium]
MNFILKPFRKLFQKRGLKKMINCIKTELLDDFLEMLLRIIRLTLCLDRGYRRNIKDFNARYAFRSEDGRIAASAIFKNNKMKMKKDAIEDTNVTVVFKDGKTLWEFLMADDPDVFSFVLENKLRYEGNLNYLLKFGYMSKRLKLMFGL